jgi:hypothetical protein
MQTLRENTHIDEGRPSVSSTGVDCELIVKLPNDDRDHDVADNHDNQTEREHVTTTEASIIQKRHLERYELTVGLEGRGRRLTAVESQNIKLTIPVASRAVVL